MSEAKVVEFVEPGAWKPKKAKAPARDSKPAQTGPVLTKNDLQSVKQDVIALGSQGLTKKEKFRMEEQRLVRLGCAPRKKPKAPLPILKGMKMKQKQREQARKQEERENDIVTASSSSKRRKRS